MFDVRPLALIALLVLAPLPGLADAHGSLADRLAAGDRADSDKQRDAERKPAEVIAFLGIQPGMAVIDLIAAGGYYTEVLSVAVGSKGSVYAQNPPRVLEFRDGANDKAMTARLAGNRLPNVTRLDQDLADVDLPVGSLDAAVTALNFHDIYNGASPEAAQDFLLRVKELLKPGGVLGLIDHSGAAGADNESLHRIDEKKVLAAVKQAGYEVESSELLRNPEDDLTLMVFDPDIRGKTDRFLLALRKPH